MRRCVELTRRAIAFTSPNPMVFALRNVGNLVKNATAYVSLESCNHYGRTLSFTEALIKAKVKRTMVGMVDPNPIVASKGWAVVVQDEEWEKAMKVRKGWVGL
ncbi:hypothetical protein V6N13_110061 [Hibiscus sabdariffa]|uniref:Uncharacterized protein n=1 Tax=Hibiscus sabdariffa TaxID=183260 RepID=A0ABR2BTS9_9ROSI